MQKSAGVLLVAGGLMLTWLFKKKFRQQFGRVHRRNVVVGPKNGGCGLQVKPTYVKLYKKDQLHWILRNEGGPCGQQVEISMANWSPSNPLEDLETGDSQGSDRRPFWRRVQAGAPVRLPAGVRPGSTKGVYRYDVLVNGNPTVDPMVEIVI